MLCASFQAALLVRLHFRDFLRYRPRRGHQPINRRIRLFHSIFHNRNLFPLSSL